MKSSSLKPLKYFHRISMGMGVGFCRNDVDNCSNGSAPLNKMAVMTIYGKTPIFFSRTKKALRDSKSTKFVQMMILG